MLGTFGGSWEGGETMKCRHVVERSWQAAHEEGLVMAGQVFRR
jgi:hypothetical protein